MITTADPLPKRIPGAALDQQRQTANTDEPMTTERLAEISAAYDAATSGPWYFETQYGPYFLASEVRGYMHGIGQLEFGEGRQADRDRAFVLNSHAYIAELLDEVERLHAVGSGCEDTARADAAKDRELASLRSEIGALRLAVGFGVVHEVGGAS